jgi:hypothetical protein
MVASGLRTQAYMQKPPGISLQLLGKFRVCSGAESPTSIRISARKSCALLGVLSAAYGVELRK